MPRNKSSGSAASFTVVRKPSGLAALAKHLHQQPVFAFDTEFLWERTYSPRLGLIQLADKSRVWLVDPLALSKSAMEPLMDVMASKNSLKVGHAIDQDQICLYSSYGVVVKPVLDTSVAAALLGLGEQISLAKLIKKVVHVSLPKGYTRTNWLKRPLSKQMQEYAAGDVRHLTKVGDVLLRRLRSLAREDWAMDLSARHADAAHAHFDPDSHARKLARSRRLDPTTYRVLRELVTWRERHARKRNLPRRWMAEDKILVNLAVAQPRTKKQLEDFRGIDGIKAPRTAEIILRAIRKGLKSSGDAPKIPARRRGPTNRESAALVVLKCFLAALAADNRLPMRFVASSNSMLDLLRGKFADVDNLRASGILDPRVVDLVGSEVVAILNGRAGLRLVDGRAVVLKESDLRT